MSPASGQQAGSLSFLLLEYNKIVILVLNLLSEVNLQHFFYFAKSKCKPFRFDGPFHSGDLFIHIPFRYVKITFIITVISQGAHTNCVIVCIFKIIRVCMGKPKGL